VLLLLVKGVFFPSSLRLTALLSWVALLTMLSEGSGRAPLLELAAAAVLLDPAAGAVLELLAAGLLAPVLVVLELLAAGLLDTAGGGGLDELGADVLLLVLETLVVLIGGVGGPPGLFVVVFGTAPLVANSGFLLTGGVLVGGRLEA